MYLHTPLDQYKYTSMPVELILDNFMNTYVLQNKIHNGYEYIGIRHGIYGLRQAEILEKISK